MSRLAKKPIAVGKATVTIADGVLSVQGPKGTLTKRVHPSISIEVTPEGIMVTPKNTSRLAKTLVGTFASHLKNMIAGVEKPFVKKLILEGVGYKAELKGKQLVLSIGFSHTVPLDIPSDVEMKVENNAMTITGTNKESVGQFAAVVRRHKPSEPYLGKGIRYEGEVILRKQGKKAV
ncbi:MAG: hypothetical protein RLZZ26_303 [Candidatus Parcubacteria bacterium]|jgi:large subunit ribosomal protein L6